MLERLREASDCRLTLLSAPAGYGKTTLLAQWRRAEEAEVPFAWVSLDEQDNDPVRLWRHTVEALREVLTEEDFGKDALMAMSAGRQELAEVALPKIINGLAEFLDPVVLVLDDYQFVNEPKCHESMVFFIEYLPDNVRLVLSSRTEPQLPVGRLRARGQMSEIRTEQLAFSEEEAASLLNGKFGLDIRPDDLLLLLERTEGWPAAIYLAALSLQTREDKHAFIDSYGGSSRYIVDLLGDEVLANLREDDREFLLRTSILRSFTGPLCDAVMETKGSGKLLRDTRPLEPVRDTPGRRGRMVSLPSPLRRAAALRAQEQPTRVGAQVLHGRASIWCEREGIFEAATRHAIAAADYERAGILIARDWNAYAFAGQTATLEHWLEALPEELVNGDPALLLVRAWILAIHGQLKESEGVLELVENFPGEGLLPDGITSVESGVATIRAVFGLGGVHDIVEMARRAAELKSGRSSPQAALVRFGLGAGLYLSGDTPGARKPLEEALELAQIGQPLLRMTVLSFLSFVAADEGDLDEARTLALEANALMDKFGLWGVPQSTVALIALGHVLLEDGELDEARLKLESGLSARRRLPGLSPWPTLLGLVALARVQLALGDRAGAGAAVAEARAILEHIADAGMIPGLIESLERKLRAGKPRGGQLDEELTERELDVLGHLDSELSTREIGYVLYVSTSTVRSHVKSIYRKLGVSSREKALEQARTRGLI